MSEMAVFPAFSFIFSRRSKRVLSGSADKTMRLWDVATGEQLRCFEGDTDSVYSVAFSPDGGWALSGGADKIVRLWDVETGKHLRSFKGHTEFVYTVAFSGDGKRVLSGGNDHTMRLWRLLGEVENGAAQTPKKIAPK